MAERILVIEDEFLVALEILSVLEDAGFENVQQVDNEEEAIRLLQREPWDAAITDANLHGRNVEIIAATLYQRSIPFLVVTGYNKTSLPSALGEAPVIEKPFPARRLIETLEAVLRTHIGSPTGH